MNAKEIIEKKYNEFIEQNGCEPQFIETEIRWKDDDTTECVYISWGDGESDPHDEEIFFHVGDWTDLADLFNAYNREDFVCLNVEQAEFSAWIETEEQWRTAQDTDKRALMVTITHHTEDGETYTSIYPCTTEDELERVFRLAVEQVRKYCGDDCDDFESDFIEQINDNVYEIWGNGCNLNIEVMKERLPYDTKSIVF